MNTVGPISLALGTDSNQIDPASGLGSQSVNCQIQNSSIFVLTVYSDGDLYTIQPFVAQTIPVASGQLVIVPTQNPSAAAGAGSTCTLVWLLNGESPPMQDGPLTAAAILASTQPSSTSLGSFTFSATSLPLEVPNIPSNTQALLLVSTGGGQSSGFLDIECQGVQSGNYYTGPYGVNVLYDATAFSAPTNGIPCIIPVIGLIDNAVNLNSTIASTGFYSQSIYVYALSLLPTNSTFPDSHISVAGTSAGSAIAVLTLPNGGGFSGYLILKRATLSLNPETSSAVGAVTLVDSATTKNYLGYISPSVDATGEFSYGASYDFGNTILPISNTATRKLNLTVPNHTAYSLDLTYLDLSRVNT